MPTGHGITEIGKILQKGSVDAYAVATFYEALHIVSLTKKKPILILEPISPVYQSNRFAFRSRRI